MNTGNSTVGSLLGAMVYQIGQMKEKKHTDAIHQAAAAPSSERKQKGRKILNKKASTMLIEEE